MPTAELRELYQQVVLDHYRRPRNNRRIEAPTYALEENNPLCGDRVTVFVVMESGRLTDISFDGCGCALCIASASLMTEMLRGKTRGEADALVTAFHQLLATSSGTADKAELGDLLFFGRLRDFPTRIPCAALPWQTVQTAFDQIATASSEE